MWSFSSKKPENIISIILEIILNFFDTRSSSHLHSFIVSYINKYYNRMMEITVRLDKFLDVIKLDICDHVYSLSYDRANRLWIYSSSIAIPRNIKKYRIEREFKFGYIKETFYWDSSIYEQKEISLKL